MQHTAYRCGCSARYVSVALHAPFFKEFRIVTPLQVSHVPKSFFASFSGFAGS